MESQTRNTALKEPRASSIERDLLDEAERLLLRNSHAQRFFTHQVSRKGEQGVLSRFASEIGSPRAGIWLHEFRRTEKSRRKERVIIKRKLDDVSLGFVAKEIGGKIHPFLSGSGEVLLRSLDLLGASKREAAIYSDPELLESRLLPEIFAISTDEGSGEVSLVMEDLDESASPAETSGQAWNERFIRAAIQGIGRIHASTLDRGRSREKSLLLSPTIDASDLETLLPLWFLSADLNFDLFTSVCGKDATELLHGNIRRAPDWIARRRQLRQCLLHNDFGPRNILFRNRPKNGVDDSPVCPCIFDWELATLGPPAHDIAELLVFTISPSTKKTEVAAHLHAHRSLLGASYSEDEYREAFVLSLNYLLANRLNLSALSAKFFPTPGLSVHTLAPALKNWLRLYQWFC